MRDGARVRVVGVAVCIAFVVGGALRAQTESMPVVDTAPDPLTAVTPKREAYFGWTGAGGKLEGVLDENDDLVIGAIQEDEAQGGPYESGALYVFLNDLLVRPSLPAKQRLVGSTIHSGMQLGRLDIKIGNVRGTDEFDVPLDNCIFAGCSDRTAEYPEPLNESVVLGGAVEIYDFNHASFDGVPSTLFAPPVEDVVPEEVGNFGNGLALGDVTRDGIDDLIVGAFKTEVDGKGIGRIYVFQGHEDFVAAPGQQPFPHPAWDHWIGLNAPEPEEGDSWGTGFGHSVAAVNLDSDEAVEVVVGRPDRDRSNSGDAPAGGTAYVLRGTYLHDLFGGYPPPTAGTLNRVNDPPEPDDVDSQSPEYQVLLNPFGAVQTPSMSNDAFGWIVGEVGDLGSPGGGALDGFPDIAIHAEGTDFIGTGSASTPEAENVGGLWIFFGHDPEEEEPDLVDPAGVLLQVPSNIDDLDPYTHGGRVGRSFAAIDLYNPDDEEVQRGLLIGHPNADWDSVSEAGRVYLLRPPFCPTTACTNPLVPAQSPNAWGVEPLLQDGGPVADAMFGSWIVVLDYRGFDPETEGQQFVVTIRQATDDGKTRAGKAVPYIPDLP